MKHHRMMDRRDQGLLAGVLLSQGSFGGDGKQPQVTLRMHTRHEAPVRRLVERFARTKPCGPDHHGDRSNVQWTARGRYAEFITRAGRRAVAAELDHEG